MNRKRMISEDLVPRIVRQLCWDKILWTPHWIVWEEHTAQMVHNKGSAYQHENILPTLKYSGGSIMIWGWERGKWILKFIRVSYRIMSGWLSTCWSTVEVEWCCRTMTKVNLLENVFRLRKSNPWSGPARAQNRTQQTCNRLSLESHSHQTS